MVYNTVNKLYLRSDGGKKSIKFCPYNMTYNYKFMTFKLLKTSLLKLVFGR